MIEVKKLVKNIFFFCLLPTILYFIFFLLYTYPAILSFSTHFFADSIDGLQNVWNLWWVNKAVTQLHQSIWYTQYLFYPKGTSLLGHTLNPFNGYMAIFLLKFLTLVQTYNAIVIFSFVMGGITAWLLSYYLTRSYWPSLIAGFIFSFSSYHFAHLDGHLQLLSLEWIPLFALFWHCLLNKPGIKLALLASLTLYAVLLCDYYYFFYCFLMAILMSIWHLFFQRRASFFRRKYVIAFLLFSVVTAFTSGIQVLSLLMLNAFDPLSGGHYSHLFSLDVFSPVIPGEHWRFHNLTRFFWSRLPGNGVEHSVYFGIANLVLAGYVWIKRRDKLVKGVGYWYFSLIIFTLLAMGDYLHIWGMGLPNIKMPYATLQSFFPVLAFSGVPVRIVVMSMLSLSIICAFGYKLLFSASKGQKIFAFVLLAILFIDTLPQPVKMTSIKVPGYVTVLKKLDRGGLIDLVNINEGQGFALYYQTIHEKPLAFGYISRTPKSASMMADEMAGIFSHGDFEKLCREIGMKYLLVYNPVQTLDIDLAKTKLLYREKGVQLFDLHPSQLCKNIL